VFRKRVDIGSAVMQAVPLPGLGPAMFWADWGTFGIHIVFRWLYFNVGLIMAFPAADSFSRHFPQD
jgi:hypothetical protein